MRDVAPVMTVVAVELQRRAEASRAAPRARSRQAGRVVSSGLAPLVQCTRRSNSTKAICRTTVLSMSSTLAGEHDLCAGRGFAFGGRGAHGRSTSRRTPKRSRQGSAACRTWSAPRGPARNLMNAHGRARCARGHDVARFAEIVEQEIGIVRSAPSDVRRRPGRLTPAAPARRSTAW